MPDRAAEPTATNSWEAPGAYQVETLKYDWLDAKRNRHVPVKIYYPADAKGQLPIIIFSHGLGGSRDGYEYLGRYWASHGYVSVHVTHIGSDTSVWQGLPFAEIKPALKVAAKNPMNIINRPADISFAIDQVEKLAKDDPKLKDRLDLAHLGVAGHSFGAFTTLAVAGEVFYPPSGDELSWVDPRVKAAIVMSPPAPEKRTSAEDAFAKIKIPIFHMTGTLDDSPLSDTTAAERRVPFDHTHTAKAYLLIFKDGDHMVFSGRPSGKNSPLAEKDGTFQKFVCTGSTAFWDAWLKDDTKAATWLAQDGYRASLGDLGTFEKKLP